MVTADDLADRYGDDPDLLGDVTVLDFTWVVAGPYGTRMLADKGADVVKIESSERMDVTRLFAPFAGDEPDRDESGYFNSFNLGKRSVGVNLKADGADEVVADLIRECDVITENFSATAMERMGFPEERIHELNPEAVYVSAPSFGKSGPKKDWLGYGTALVGRTGIVDRTGYPERGPQYIGFPVPDYVTANLLVRSVLLGLLHRERTGEGVAIDIDQYRGSIGNLGPLFVEHSVRDGELPRRGNRVPGRVPSDVFPCAGEDRWVAISVATDDQWRTLCDELDRPDWADWDRDDRWDARDRIHDAVAARTDDEEDAAVAARLRDRGVPAQVAQDMRDVASDDRLRDAEFLVEVEHEGIGSHPYTTLPYRMSETPAYPRGEAPSFTGDTVEVIRDTLGYDEDRIDDLLESGALEQN